VIEGGWVGAFVFVPSRCIPDDGMFRGGVELRSAVDCYALEAEQISLKELVVVPLPASLSLAATDSLSSCLAAVGSMRLKKK
jgi:hypothetical protein